MANNSTDDDSQNTRLPDGRSIFNLITSNNLDAIRSLLTPLTLHDRQLIVYQRVGNKTLLYYACELGFRDIAKYLLDECGADIDDGYCDSSESVSPTRVGTKRLDIFLLTLLMRRGAAVQENSRTISCVYYAFKMKYYALMSSLMLYKNRINRTNIVASRSVRHAQTLASYGISIFNYNTRNMDFLTAAATGNIAQIKTILASGVNRDFQNYEGENALCLTIMNEQKNAMHFLINYKTYSLKSYALALELCGAKFIVFLSENQKGLECWRKSTRVRRENCIGFSDKNQVRTQSDLGIEFQTEEEINRLQNTSLYIQALLIFLRLLSRSSDVTRSAFRMVAQHQIFQEDLLLCLKILSELYCSTQTDGTLILYPTEQALETMDDLFRSHFQTRCNGKTEDLLKFGSLFDFLDAEIWGAILRDSLTFYDIAYEQLLAYVLFNMNRMTGYDLSQDEKEWIEKGVRVINKRCSSRYPTTLIHEAIHRKCPLSVVALLLKCSSDANCQNRLKNTPLHLVSSLYNKNSYSIQLSNLLIEAGAHIDSVNRYGTRPLEVLQEKGIIEKPLKYLSLQCLAARAIGKFGIVVSEEDFPIILVRFIRLHSA